MDELLSVKQAAAYLGLCTETVRRAIHRGDLPAVRVFTRGGPWRIRREDLDRLTNPGAASPPDMHQKGPGAITDEAADARRRRF